MFSSIILNIKSICTEHWVHFYIRMFQLFVFLYKDFWLPRQAPFSSYSLPQRINVIQARYLRSQKTRSLLAPLLVGAFCLMSKLLVLENIPINLVFSSLLAIFVAVPCRLHPLWVWEGVGQCIIKGVYYALILTIRNPGKISFLSGTRQRECPSWVCYTYSPIVHCQPMVYPYAKGVWPVSRVNYIHISAWGLGVARFDRMGNSRSL